jgi:hypothetical protein
VVSAQRIIIAKGFCCNFKIAQTTELTGRKRVPNYQLKNDPNNLEMQRPLLLVCLVTTVFNVLALHTSP